MLTPYHTDERSTLYHGDALDVLRALPDGSVDAVLTDPPYGDTALAWDVAVRGWLPLVRPLLAPHGSVWVFGSLRHIASVLAEAGSAWRLAQDIVWEKQNGSGFATDRFRRVHEHAVQLYPRDVSWGRIYKAVPRIVGAPRRGSVARRQQPPHTGAIGQHTYEFGDDRQARSVIYARNCHGKALHPTQKPVDVLRPLVVCSCPPGGVVLDPFAGSGSAGVAAIAEGRRFVGVERDAGYVEVARTRLVAAMPDLPPASGQ